MQRLRGPAIYDRRGWMPKVGCSPRAGVTQGTPVLAFFFMIPSRWP